MMRLLPALLFCISLFAADVRPLFVEGYSGKVSYVAGEEVTFHVSTGAEKFGLEIARIGATNAVVLRTNGVAGAEHPVPENASSHGCGWPASYRFKLPAEWESGYYEVRLRAEDRGGDYTHRGKRTAESDFFFVVRPKDPGARTKILLQLASNTYSAYNNWGGFCLYSFNARAKVQGHRVSFERPPSSLFNNWERPFVEWAERSGYVLDFCANMDLEEHPELLKAYKLVLSVGHDEYWSSGMRDSLERFIGDGGNVAFFSGNSGLLAGETRRWRKSAHFVEAMVQPGSSVPERRSYTAIHSVEPSLGESSGESVDRCRFSLGRISSESRSVHGRQRGLHGTSA
jgi:hypothetical protein